MKKVISLLLAAVMLLGLAACGGGETPATEPPETDPAPAATTPPPATDPPATEPAGELVETSRWSMRYDPQVWAWEEEDALDETDYRSMLTLIIPDPENEGEELVWLRVRAMETDHDNFRANLRNGGFDQYEYAVNNAYDTVSIGGLDFLLDNTSDDYWIYFTRLVGAGVDAEIIVTGDVTNPAVEELLQTLNFTIDDGDNVDPPWFWEGQPYAVDPGEAVVGTFTLQSVQIPFAEPIVTYDTFNHNVAVAGETVYISSSDEPASYSFDGTTLTYVGSLGLEDSYAFIEPADDGSIWCSYLTSPLIKWDGSAIVASYKDTKSVAIHPDGSWGISWFSSPDVAKLTFAGGAMTTEAVTLAELQSISHMLIDANGYLYACGSAATGDGHKVFVYNEKLELVTTLQDSDGGGLGSITFATSTDNGFLVIDGNMRDIILYTPDGTYIGACDMSDLCGTDYPWPCDADVLADGSILVVVTDERQDESADELIAFKISGF